MKMAGRPLTLTGVGGVSDSCTYQAVRSAAQPLPAPQWPEWCHTGNAEELIILSEFDLSRSKIRVSV